MSQRWNTLPFEEFLSGFCEFQDVFFFLDVSGNPFIPEKQHGVLFDIYIYKFFYFYIILVVLSNIFYFSSLFGEMIQFD